MAYLVEMYACEICERAYHNEEDADACCNTPQLLDKPKLSELKYLAESIVRLVKAQQTVPKDAEQQCYEKLLEAYYGPVVFSWINRICSNRH